LQEDDGLGPIVRVRKREKNIERGLASAIGYLSTLAAWVGGDLTSPDADMSLVLRWLYGASLDYLDERDLDFSKLVQALPNYHRAMPFFGPIMTQMNSRAFLSFFRARPE
jgi:hypothetical protein